MKPSASARGSSSHKRPLTTTFSGTATGTSAACNGLWWSLFTSQRAALWNTPVVLLVVVASLDHADKQLLASSFPLLERTLHLDVDTLGYFSLTSNLSYALSLPLWGYLVHRYGMAHIHLLLSAACAAWGLSTMGIAATITSVWGQAAFRCCNGVALGSILPLSQTLLVGMVPKRMRGRAFGWMGCCEKMAGTAAAACIIYFDRHWQWTYYALGMGSVLVAGLTVLELTPFKRQRARGRAKQQLATASGNRHASGDDPNKEDYEDDGDDGTEKTDHHQPLNIRQIVQRIVRIPAFLCLVAQGIFGGTPWDMMSFLLLLLDWRQFTKAQIVSIQCSTGLTSTLGGWMGGFLGDYAQHQWGTRGRIGVALVSVLGGIPLYGMFLFAASFRMALLWTILFHVCASWTPAAALRPICADLARNPSERAQIVSLWIVLEKTSGAILGAPLVGFLTRHMLQSHDNEGDNASAGADMTVKAQALAWNLFGLSTIFWCICAGFWVGMAYSLDSEHLRIHTNANQYPPTGSGNTVHENAKALDQELPLRHAKE